MHLSHETSGIRTPDNLIKSQVLYHLSYTPLYNCLLAKNKQNNRVGNGIRTHGLQSHNLAR